MSKPDTEMSWAEIADGLALWEEHKPQSYEDWIRIAGRWIDDHASTADVSHLFQALVFTVAALREIAETPMPHREGHQMVSIALAALSPTERTSND